MKERKIVIENQNPVPLPKPVEPKEKVDIDLQDVLLVGGSISLIFGVALIYIPAAFIIVGLLCMGFVGMIERVGPRKTK